MENFIRTSIVSRKGLYSIDFPANEMTVQVVQSILGHQEVFS